MFFSLDAQSEDNVRWYLENCSMFTVQRANLKMPVCSEELEQQFMAKSLGEVMTITGDSPAVPRFAIDLKHAAFERCYQLRFVNKRTRLTVTAKQLRRWLHLPTIYPRLIGIHLDHIDGGADDIIELLMRLHKKFLVDGRNDVNYRLSIFMANKHFGRLYSRLAEVEGSHSRERSGFHVSTSSYIAVTRWARED